MPQVEQQVAEAEANASGGNLLEEVDDDMKVSLYNVHMLIRFYLLLAMYCVLGGGQECHADNHCFGEREH